ncbi:MULTISPECIES: trehalose-phosphatase [unclassified Janthinobacterium]|jgi:trehalose 6-phosphate phosphatase|uniref:Trehalose 6-phosphate phosphatase n=1 Tax=Janthinobacterium lividum TaxID=29581 RepID=A0A1E8PJN5_9BURK|nr:trehalose-phosphatase [Janthinobacterium sp. CG_23.4]MDH6158202.1 trehalose 6-phosphate phosphatase [Janthinobacterium sp. CG_23.4]OFJ46476.1 trehalose-phosphatase [Janthinobacterium lividum]
MMQMPDDSAAVLQLLSKPGSAVFLDFDGTLVDLAPTPDGVHLEGGIVQALALLAERHGGALALISGRPVAQIDAMLAPLLLPVAGVHGVERRGADGALHVAATPDVSSVLARALALASAHPGLLVEQKRGAVALHYRLAPELEHLCSQEMTAAVQACPGLLLLHGKMVVEAKPAASDKGGAIAAFMREAPFAGRRPVFAGDDTTDEAGFAFVQQVRGQGVKVGSGPSAAILRLASPGALRAALLAAAISS